MPPLKLQIGSISSPKTAVPTDTSPPKFKQNSTPAAAKPTPKPSGGGGGGGMTGVLAELQAKTKPSIFKIVV